MESKKINQLATELAPELSDLTIIGDPTTGISKKITLSQMASLFTGTVEEYANLASFPLVGTADTIYIALNTNIIYRWNTGTSAYVELSPNIVTSLVFNDANGFDGTISLVGSTATLTITTALTQGSIGFIGASGALTQDNSNFFWDNTNKRLGINTNTPTTSIDAFGSGIIGRLNGTSTNNAFLGFASAGSNKWSIGNVQSDHRFRIYSEANTAELVSVLQTGEVGIGIANPLTKLHIFGGASALIANLDANTSVAKSISFRSGNSSRINLEVSGTESGSNAGANFYLRTYSDAGSLLATPLTIIRSTGAATFSSTVTASNGTLIGGSGTINTIPRFSASTALIDSAISDNGSLVTIARQTKISNNLKIYGDTYTSVEIQDGGTGDPGYVYFYNYGTKVASIGAADTFFNTGNVGIGTATPSYRFEVSNSGTGVTVGDFYVDTANNAVYVGRQSSTSGDNSKFYVRNRVNTLTALSVDPGGNGAVDVVGTFTSTRGTSLATATGNVLIGGTTAYSSRKLEVNGYVRSNGYDVSIATTTSGYVLPQGEWTGVSNSNLAIAAEGGKDITFYTNGSASEKMRLNTGGELKITGQGSSSTAFSIYDGTDRRVFCIPSQYYGYIFAVSVAANGGKAISIGNAGGASEVGSIVANASSTTYNTSSDYRLKEDLKDFDGLDILSKIKFYDFKWKSENARTTGVIAHELQSIVPYAVQGEKDEIGIEGKPSYQGVDYSKLVAIQGRAIQQLEARIKQLEAK